MSRLSGLVDAALGDGPVPSASPEAVEEGVMMRQLNAMPLPEAFDLLRTKSPQLDALALGLEDGSVTVVPVVPIEAEPIMTRRGIPKDEWLSRSGIHPDLLRMAGLRELLQPIVGRASLEGDPMVRTSIAFTIAMRSLIPFVNPEQSPRDSS